MTLPTREEAQHLVLEYLAKTEAVDVQSAQVHATIALAWATLAVSLPAAGSNRDRPFSEAASR